MSVRRKRLAAGLICGALAVTGLALRAGGPQVLDGLREPGVGRVVERLVTAPTHVVCGERLLPRSPTISVLLRPSRMSPARTRLLRYSTPLPLSGYAVTSKVPPTPT